MQNDLKTTIMKSKHYHDLLLNEYENKELSKEDLSSTLKHYANLYFKERLRRFFFLGWLQKCICKLSIKT